MQIKPSVTYYHDCRRALKDGKFPVKIIVSFEIRKDKYFQDPYGTGVALSPAEYKKIWSDSVPLVLREKKKKIEDLRKKIDDVIEKSGRLTPPLLRNRVTGAAVQVNSIPVTFDVKQIFEAMIKQYEKEGRIGSRNSCRDAMGSLLRFGGEGLMITDINEAWLEGYERWGLQPIHKKNIESKESKPLALSTIGMYLRNLRHAFNILIENGVLTNAQYPFGKNKYVIRTEETIKHALDSTQKEKVFNHEITDPDERRALAMWMFSYYCHGMNFTDMANLRPEKVFSDRLVFVREKTKRTVKHIKPHEVPLRAEVKQILQEYGQNKPYCFGVIDDTMDAETKHRKIKQWYRWVNKYMNRIADRLGVPFKVNTYNARHTTAKQLIEKGAHLQYIQEILTHTLPQTTQAYTRGMNIDKSKELTDLL